MPQELLKFIKVGENRFRVEIHGDFLKDCGVMNLDDILPFLKHLKIIAATPEEVIQWLRDGPRSLLKNIKAECRAPVPIPCR
jgi:hypothetical protein